MSAGRIAAVVQARMGSTRRPAKMMEPLAGEPLIRHILVRALAIPAAAEVVLATTTDPRDGALAEVAAALGVTVVRGPEEDVMARFLMAAEASGAEYLIRLCGDAPLFDPVAFSQQAERLRERGADLVLWRPPGVVTAHQGAEAVSLRALRWSRERAPHDRRVYEHVVAYARDHWQEVATLFVDHDPRFAGRFKFSIDTQEDLEFMREIYRRLWRPGALVALAEAVQLVRGDPALAAENERLYRSCYGG